MCSLTQCGGNVFDPVLHDQSVHMYIYILHVEKNSYSKKSSSRKKKIGTCEQLWRCAVFGGFDRNWTKCVSYSEFLQHASVRFLSSSRMESSHWDITNTLQHTATHCKTLQHTATRRFWDICTRVHTELSPWDITNTLHHTATHCNTLQHDALRYMYMCTYRIESLRYHEHLLLN